MNDPLLHTERDALLNAFGEHPPISGYVDRGHYDRIAELREQRLSEIRSKPHTIPGSPACNVNDFMDEILS